MPKKDCNIWITTSIEKGKIIVRVRGVTSGFVTHTEADNSTIEFGFDASRFCVNIFVNDKHVFRYG